MQARIEALQPKYRFELSKEVVPLFFSCSMAVGDCPRSRTGAEDCEIPRKPIGEPVERCSRAVSDRGNRFGMHCATAQEECS